VRNVDRFGQRSAAMSERRVLASYEGLRRGRASGSGDGRRFFVTAEAVTLKAGSTAAWFMPPVTDAKAGSCDLRGVWGSRVRFLATLRMTTKSVPIVLVGRRAAPPVLGFSFQFVPGPYGPG
jgi:hypothetical protein